MKREANLLCAYIPLRVLFEMQVRFAQNKNLSVQKYKLGRGQAATYEPIPTRTQRAPADPQHVPREQIMTCKIIPKFVYLNQRGRAGFVLGEVRDSPLAPFPTALWNREIFILTQARQCGDRSDPAYKGAKTMSSAREARRRVGVRCL